ncbi:MAG TPA: hypothetical protein DEF88_00700 [Porphyromonadaceae bacterium]|jgi:hypothetical protein|nr:hypothetical protein [Porphyromonadaceae bacterium]
MAKKQIFYSFHYQNDNWRVSQVRNIGAIEGNAPATSNEWEEVKRKGDNAIQSWIDNSMKYRSCVVVLIGSETAQRRWVNYEIEKAWKEGKGVVGIYIHGLKDSKAQQCSKGDNPFYNFCIDETINYIADHSKPIDNNEINLSKVVKAYDSPYLRSENVYSYIQQNIEDWIEEAIRIRNNYPK